MDQCVVGPDEAELVARALGCRLMRASVKEDVNVGAVFRALAARCLSDMRREESAENGRAARYARHRFIHEPQQQRDDPAAADEAPTWREEEEYLQKCLQNMKLMRTLLR